MITFIFKNEIIKLTYSFNDMKIKTAIVIYKKHRVYYQKYH